MKTRTTISLLAVIALAFASASAVAAKGGKQGPGAQAQSHSQLERGQKDGDRDRDRIHAQDHSELGGDDIYGHELMSVEERNQHREQLKLTESDPKARAKLMAAHKEEMQERAKQRNVKIQDAAETEEAE